MAEPFENFSNHWSKKSNFLFTFRSLRRKLRHLAESSKLLKFLWISKALLNHEEVGAVVEVKEEVVEAEVAEVEEAAVLVAAVPRAVKVQILT